jgi:hypothetical protein
VTSSGLCFRILGALIRSNSVVNSGIFNVIPVVVVRELLRALPFDSWPSRFLLKVAGCRSQSLKSQVESCFGIL